MAEPEVKNPYAPTTPFYSPKEFNYDEQLALKYGTEASRRDKRKFKRYWNSDQRHEDQLAFDKAETDKMFASADTRFKEIKEAWNANNSKPQLVTKPTTPTTPTTPAVEPTTPSIEDQIAGAKSFNEAFGLARKAGLKEFNWKGKPIAVKLAENTPATPATPTAPSAEESYNAMFAHTPWAGYTPTEEDKAAQEQRTAAQQDARRQAKQEQSAKIDKFFSNPVMKFLTGFGNAQIAGESGAGTAMAIANGYEVNPETHRWEQTAERFNDPSVAALRNNLAVMGAGVTAGTAAAALAPVAGAAGASTTLPATVETIVPEVVQTAGVPALRQAGTTAVQAMGRAAGTGAQRALPQYANALYDKAGNLIRFWKQGGSMNRINYFQQGGQQVAPQQSAQSEDEQLIAVVQAAMQGDQEATQTVNQILKAAKAGDPKAQQYAQKIQQIVEAIKQKQGQQTPVKRYGSKLNYIRSLKYANGGKTCPSCQKGGMPVTSDKAYTKSNKKIEEKACGGKAKKRYFGGWL